MSAEFETVVEKTSFSGSPQTSWKLGETAYAKWFDNTSGKWERWSGSGAPTVVISGTIPTTLVGTAVSGSVGITGSAVLNAQVRITGSSITQSVSGSVSIASQPISTKPVEMTPLYSGSDFSIGAGLQTGSGVFSVGTSLKTTAIAFIGTQTNGSGSIVVSGSDWGSTYHPFITGSVFYSGSYSILTWEDLIPIVSVHLLNLNTGSAITGSLWLISR